MEKKTLTIPYVEYSYEELDSEDRELVELARQACSTSYAPYSKFRVGAAVRFVNGETMSGSNQENAAYPAGICAERCTVFYANAMYPDRGIATIALAAKGTDGRLTPFAISPCGICRQVLVETQKRYGGRLRCLMSSGNKVIEVSSVSDLLPFQFDADALN